MYRIFQIFNQFEMKGKPRAPQACDHAGNWFEHRRVGNDTALVPVGNTDAQKKATNQDTTLLPPIFTHRNRRNYRNSNLFSQFDNRWDHEKRKKIVTELTHRHKYESPEMLVSNILWVCAAGRGPRGRTPIRCCLGATAAPQER